MLKRGDDIALMGTGSQFRHNTTIFPVNGLACGDIGKDFASVPYSYGGVVATAFYAQYSGI
jgi:hypothetical protein